MRVERYAPARRGPQGWLIALGCVVTFSLGAVLLCAGFYATGRLVPLILSLGGVENLGDTDELFSEPVVPTPQVVNGTSPSRVTVDLGEFGSQSIEVDPRDFTLQVGSSTSGSQLATATFTEVGLLQLCNQRSTVCTGSDGRYRNASIDLRPGGAVVYADINTGMFWQRIGVVFRLDAGRTSLNVAGVDIDGVTYNPDTLPGLLPPDVRQQISGSVDEIEAAANDVLQQLVIQSSGQSYRLTDIIVDDTLLTLVLQ